VVEDRLGRLRYLALYLLCGVVSVYAFALTDPAGQSPLVGASGAISAVLGAYLVVQFRSRVSTLVVVFPVRLPGWALVGTYFVLQFVPYISLPPPTGGGGSAAYAAHVYGFTAGVLGGRLSPGVRWRSGPRLSALYCPARARSRGPAAPAGGRADPR